MRWSAGCREQSDLDHKHDHEIVEGGDDRVKGNTLPEADNAPADGR
ncbi:MAG: hypothetical protein AB8B58_01530 [Roseobacter sp.]